MRCTCPADCKPSVWCSVSGAWSRKGLYQSGQAGPLRAAARLSASETTEVCSCPRDPDFFRLVPPLAAVHLCIQLVGGEGHPLLTSFGPTQTHFLSPHRPLSSIWSLGHIQLPGWLGSEVQPCGLPVKARGLYHISPTQGHFIRNGIQICDTAIILYDTGVYFQESENNLFSKSSPY